MIAGAAAADGWLTVWVILGGVVGAYVIVAVCERGRR